MTPKANLRIYILSWIELVGIVRYVSPDKSCDYLETASRLLFIRQESQDSDSLDELCKGRHRKKVGILFTDRPEKPMATGAIVHTPKEIVTLKT